MTMEEKLSYSEAIAELEQIVEEIEEGTVSVDELSEKVKRAAYLLRICKEKLTSTEDDVKKILDEIENKEKPGSD
jgi:exodeoxyribonuclease VII small subunit